MHPDLISRREAAELLEISVSMIRKLERTGRLHPVHGADGRVLYRLHQVHQVQAARGAGTGSVQAPISDREHDDLAVHEPVNRLVHGLDDADQIVPADQDRTPPGRAEAPTSTAWPTPPPWRLRDEPTAVAADTANQPATTATAELDALESARRQLDASWVRLRRERVALERAARDLARERAERDRQAWRANRIAEVVDGVGLMLVTAGWPMPMLGFVADQLGGWLGQLDDQALADDGVIGHGVSGMVATAVLGPVAVRT